MHLSQQIQKCLLMYHCSSEAAVTVSPLDKRPLRNPHTNQISKEWRKSIITHTSASKLEQEKSGKLAKRETSPPQHRITTKKPLRTEITMNKIPFLTSHNRQFHMMTPETHTVQKATPLTCAMRYKASFSDAPWEKMSMSPVSIIDAKTWTRGTCVMMRNTCDNRNSDTTLLTWGLVSYMRSKSKVIPLQAWTGPETFSTTTSH
jgi:hypothetical protein